MPGEQELSFNKETGVVSVRDLLLMDRHILLSNFSNNSKTLNGRYVCFEQLDLCLVATEFSQTAWKASNEMFCFVVVVYSSSSLPDLCFLRVGTNEVVEDKMSQCYSMYLLFCCHRSGILYPPWCFPNMSNKPMVELPHCVPGPSCGGSLDRAIHVYNTFLVYNDIYIVWNENRNVL